MAKVVADIVIQSHDRLLGFFSETPEDASICGYPVLGMLSSYRDYPDARFVIAIGSAAVREDIVSKMPDAKWYTAIHPSAIISPLHTSIGEGSIIAVSAVVNPFASVGKHCIINSCSLVEHDNVIGDYVHLSSGAKCAGMVEIGKATWVGVGACIKDHTSICSHCMIGAGAVVVSDIAQSGTYVGVPAKII